MLVTAAWVVPVSRPPVRDGAVLVRGDVIAEVGTRADLAVAYPDERVVDLGSCTITPGLVNAHTHLALTVMHGVVPPAPFHEWIARLVCGMRVLTSDDFAASTSLGAHHCITSGTTVVGDIAYGPESLAIATSAGLAGVHFWEVLGISASDVASHLEGAGYPADPATEDSPRVRHALSAHAPYTTGPELIGALHALAAAHNVAFAIHLAESPAEVELVRDGTGPLADVTARNAPDFAPTGTSPARYLDRLGALDGALAVHCVHTADDTALLAEKTAGVVLCPRSNAYLHTGTAPVAALDAAGARLALGTDSLASNHDLDLCAEARVLHALAPSLPAERIVRMMTRDGAEALGLSARVGSLEPGMQADFAAFELGACDDPYTSLLERGGRNVVEAVMSAGVWRVLAGQPTEPSHFTSLAVRRAAARAAAAIA